MSLSSLSTGTTIHRTGVSGAQAHRMGRPPGTAVSILVLSAFAGLGLLLVSTPDNPDIIFALGVSLIFALCIIRWPVTGTYMALVMSILFDTLPSAHAHTVFSDLGVFRNLSYLGLPDGVTVSLFELVILVSLLSSIVHRFHQRERLVKGPLFWPMLAFGAMIVAGEVSGILSGGDFKISLWEIRPLMYLVALYILTVNTVKEAAQTRAILWLTIVCVGVRCAEGIWRYSQIPADARATVSTVLEHEDSLFLVIPFALLLVVFLWRRWLPGPMLLGLAALIPVAFYVIIINHRRAAFLCIFLTIASCLPLIWVTLNSKQQRGRFVYALTAAALAGMIYLGAFWNSSSGVAAPAQAVRSMIQPDERDYQSNLYRDQENINLRYTISFSPYTGIGFGKPMQLITPMVDLEAGWALQLYMPHNNMLWLWMRMGIVGFVTFWVLAGSAILLIATCLRLGLERWRLLGLGADVRGSRLEGELKTPTIGRTKVAPQKGSPPNTPAKNSGSYNARQQVKMLAGERAECAQSIILVFLAQIVLVSLIGIAIVDQGLMSSRLSAYAGVVLGGLAVVWQLSSALVEQPDKVMAPAAAKIETDAAGGRVPASS